ncbi:MULTISPECIES: spore coat protein [unclassified Staphylococcus]|nr:MULTISPECIES: spore coat protein [unclassified Staphylococcus]
MHLKPCKQVLRYYPAEKITEYELLTAYNPMFINRKIQTIEEQIECMYSLNTSHMTCDDVMGVVTTSYPLEKLVCWIVEKKDELDRYKKQSNKRLNLVKKLIKHYPSHEQKAIIQYMQSNGSYKPHKTIEKLQKDLYQVHHKNRSQRREKHIQANKVIYNDYIETKRESLQNEREVLAI